MLPSAVVIDASLAVRALSPTRDAEVLGFLADCCRRNLRLIAPDLWVPESVSAVRQAVFRRALSPEEGLIVLGDLFALGVEVIASSMELCRSAMGWAERLGQAKCYDGLYLALAEQTGAELWTADRRLANRARQIGATWVHCLGEEDAHGTAEG